MVPESAQVLPPPPLVRETTEAPPLLPSAMSPAKTLALAAKEPPKLSVLAPAVPLMPRGCGINSAPVPLLEKEKVPAAARVNIPNVFAPPFQVIFPPETMIGFGEFPRLEKLSVPA